MPSSSAGRPKATSSPLSASALPWAWSWPSGGVVGVIRRGSGGAPSRSRPPSWHWLLDSATLTTLGHTRLPSPLSDQPRVWVFTGGQAVGRASAHSGCFHAADSPGAAESRRLREVKLLGWGGRGGEGRGELRLDTRPLSFTHPPFLWTLGSPSQPCLVTQPYSELSSYQGKVQCWPPCWRGIP